ncbi:alpha-galactosidase [Echinicola salinicaeni]|uniref:hypothetical protein n=1 Tax=Echinicola salinicaeni TaxID=2762757 RepID=UPI0016446B07|nr:hypothetical protein [Echinicola salinicaeni]
MKNLRGTLCFFMVVLFIHCSQAKEKIYRISNKSISRNIKLENGSLKTISFVNKNTKEEIPVNTLYEFQLRISEGTDKEGTDRLVNSDAFQLKKVLKEEKEQLSFLLESKQYGLEVELDYALNEGEFYTNKKLKIRSQMPITIERVDLELVDGGVFQPYQKKLITAKGPAQWKPGLGQPLFGEDAPFFMGVEFPASYNYVEEGKAYCGYLIGKSLKAGEAYSSYSSVFGLGEKQETIERTFQKYISEKRVRPLRLQVQYNSWFDFGGSVDKEKFAQSVAKVHQELVSERGVPALNAYVIDDGWQDVQADWSDKVWKVNGKFDTDFKFSFDQVGQASSQLGLWLSPGCLFGAQRAAKKLGEQGFELLGNWMSMAGPKYMGLLEKRMLELTESGISYFKLDGVFGHLNIREFELNGKDYGVPTMPQLATAGLSPSDSLLNDPKYDELKTYYLVAGTERLMEIFKKQHEINPEVYIVISNGAYLSPWWLMYIDAVWMINAGDAARGSSRTEELVYRDGVYYDIWKEEKTQFPMNSIFNHEPKKVKTGESKEGFMQYLLMNLSRGTGFVELYLKTPQLSEDDWDVLADGLKWAHHAFPYFETVAMHGGDPKEMEVYGYTGWNEKGGYFSIHNPNKNEAVDYSIDLGSELVMMEKSGNYGLKMVIGDMSENKASYKLGDKISVNLKPGEVKILEFELID